MKRWKRLNEGIDKRRVWRDSCTLLSYLFTGFGCAHIAYAYNDIMWRELLMKEFGYGSVSARPGSALILAVPYGLLVLGSVIVAAVLTSGMKKDDADE